MSLVAGEAGQTASGGAAQAGTAGGPSVAGSPVGGASEGGSAGGADAGGSAVDGGAGGEAAGPCLDLSCLAGADLIYQPTAEWQGTNAVGMGDSIDLDSANYVKKMGLTPFSLHFSADASELTMTPVGGSEHTRAARDPKHTDRAWYSLELFAGGRFVVRVEADGLRAEHTTYGSGNPIIGSTVGYIE